MMITKKRAKELLEVLDEVRETHFKDREKDYPYSEWEKKREKVKERLRNLRDYVRRAVDAIQREEQKAGRPPKLDLEKKVMLFLFAYLFSGLKSPTIAFPQSIAVPTQGSSAP